MNKFAKVFSIFAWIGCAALYAKYPMGTDLAAEEAAQPPAAATSAEPIKPVAAEQAGAGSAEEPAKPVVAERAGDSSAQEPATPKAPAPEPPVEKEPETARWVMPLKLLQAGYEKEIASVKKLMERWNKRFDYYLKREKDAAADIKKLEAEIAEKAKSTDKKVKKEIKRLEKQLELIKKEQKKLAKDVAKLCEELSAEIKTASKDSQAVLKEIYAQVQQDLKDLIKGKE